MGERTANRAKLGKLLACALLFATLAARVHAQDEPPPQPPPYIPPPGGVPASTLPPITVPTPSAPGGRCQVIDPAPKLNPFAPLLPPPAGVALADSSHVYVDFWAIGEHHLGNLPSNVALSQLTLAYEFRYALGPFTLGARPQFDVMFLNGPTPPGPDLPPQTYGLSVALEAEFRIDPRFSVRAIVQPGVFTDFNHVSGHAFRMPSQLIGAYELSPRWILVGGVMYTAQPSWSVLPVVGAIWMPVPEWRLELTFPRLRAVRHFPDGLNIYGQFDVFGETYAIDEHGTGDLLQYRDWRLGLGAEWNPTSRLNLFLEAGVAFWRRLELNNQWSGSVDPGLYLRVGGRF
jgi:hypothetical protein